MAENGALWLDRQSRGTDRRVTLARVTDCLSEIVNIGNWPSPGAGIRLAIQSSKNNVRFC